MSHRKSLLLSDVALTLKAFMNIYSAFLLIMNYRKDSMYKHVSSACIATCSVDLVQ